MGSPVDTPRASSMHCSSAGSETPSLEGSETPTLDGSETPTLDGSETPSLEGVHAPSVLATSTTAIRPRSGWIVRDMVAPSSGAHGTRDGFSSQRDDETHLKCSRNGVRASFGICSRNAGHAWGIGALGHWLSLIH